MRINCLKKYLFGNVIAFWGYLVLIFYIHYFLIVRPKELAFKHEMIQKYGEVFLSGLYETFYFMVYTFLIIFFLALLLIEFLIRKKFKPEFFKNISIPENIVKIYSILFWVGLFFTTLPIWFFLHILWIFFISSFRY